MEPGTETPTEAAAAARVRAAAVSPDLWVGVPSVADPLLQNLTIPADAPTRGMWSGVIPFPLNPLHAAVLPSGKVLGYGSPLDGGSMNGYYLDLWDPAQGTTTASHLTTYRRDLLDSFCSTSVLLADGRLMITGGNGNTSSMIYTPSTNSAAMSTARLADDRWYATMLTLPDGRPIMLGGMAPFAEGMQGNPDQSVAQGLASMTPEVYENGGWRSLPGAYSRDAFGPDYLRASYPRAWVMPGGKVFGVSAERMWTLDPAGNGSVSVHGVFKGAPSNTANPQNVGASNSAVMYDIGKVLIVGGNGSYNGEGWVASNKATSINVNSGSPVLTEQPAMSNPRRYPNTIVLPDGKVLVTGGTRKGNDNGANAVYAAEIWNPDTGTWTVGASAAVYRGYHSNTLLLPNGTVLSAGGGTPGPVTNLNGEIYYPPHLFRSVNGSAQLAPRPVIAAISGLSYAHGAELQLDMGSANPIAKLSLIALSNGTHSFNNGQRRIPVGFTQDTIRLSTRVPAADLAPPGYYQVVAIDAAGVPSRGVIVSIGQGVAPPPTPTTPYNPPSLEATISAPILGAGGMATYTVAASAGVSYSWNFGDGSGDTAFSSTASTTHSFALPGLYTVTLSARASNGSESRRTFVQAVTGPTTARSPGASSVIALETRAGASARLWVANPDTDTVAVIDAVTRTRTAEIAVGSSPRSVAVAPDGRLWVVNKGAATISVVHPGTLALVQTVTLPRGSQPHGLAFAPGGGSAYVVLEAAGRLLRLDAASGAQQAAVDVGAHPRHVSVSADAATVLVSRFITPPLPGESTATVDTRSAGAEVLALRGDTLAPVRTIVLRHSDKTDAEIQGSGIPNYLAAAVISPDGASAWVSSKQDNIKRGMLRNGQALDFQNTVRAISSRIDLSTLTEDLPSRIDHDNASLGSAAAFHPQGAYLFVALETSRQVAVISAHNRSELFRVEVGRAPQGLAVSADGHTLYVQNFMDRSLSVVDLSPLTKHGELRAELAATPSTAGTEKLPAQVLAGKQLFYDAKDPRLARDAYMSCASCHNDGDQDGRVWDLTGFGEGLRNTIALRGRAALGHGFLHWSANFDELQDFEGQIRALAGGTGLMSDAQFNTGTRNTPLGDKKAGVSADLDALAAYVSALNRFEASPWRNADASMTAAAMAGKAVFQTAACTSCHTGAGYTVSTNASGLKSIGTLKASSGKRLGGPLSGLDVPTLRDVWATVPYLHDGSAPSLAAAVQAHQGNTVAGNDLANLVAYLEQIGSDEAGFNLVASNGTGLQGAYYATNNLSGAVVFQRVEGREPQLGQRRAGRRRACRQLLRTLGYRRAGSAGGRGVPVPDPLRRWGARVDQRSTGDRQLDLPRTHPECQRDDPADGRPACARRGRVPGPDRWIAHPAELEAAGNNGPSRSFRPRSSTPRPAAAVARCPPPANAAPAVALSAPGGQCQRGPRHGDHGLGQRGGRRRQRGACGVLRWQHTDRQRHLGALRDQLDQRGHRCPHAHRPGLRQRRRLDHQCHGDAERHGHAGEWHRHRAKGRLLRHQQPHRVGKAATPRGRQLQLGQQHSRHRRAKGQLLSALDGHPGSRGGRHLPVPDHVRRWGAGVDQWAVPYQQLDLPFTDGQHRPHRSASQPVSGSRSWWSTRISRGGAQIQLRWKAPGSTNYVVVPTNRLYTSP